MLFRSVLSMEEAAGAWVLRRPRGHLCWVLRRRYIWGILEVRIDRAKRRVPPAGHVRGTVAPRAVTRTTALARGTVGPGSAPPASARSRSCRCPVPPDRNGSTCGLRALPPPSWVPLSGEGPAKGPNRSDLASRSRGAAKPAAAD